MEVSAPGDLTISANSADIYTSTFAEVEGVLSISKPPKTSYFVNPPTRKTNYFVKHHSNYFARIRRILGFRDTHNLSTPGYWVGKPAELQKQEPAQNSCFRSGRTIPNRAFGSPG